MLNVRDRREKRPPRSLRAEYQEFIEQRIEEYKDNLPREAILGIGDEAIQELGRTDQLALTEVVLSEQVDAIIKKRLRLPSFRRWREKHLALRTAQSQPAHWGLSAHDPVVTLAELLEDQDPVLQIGAADGACALFLAARGAQLVVLDPDIAAILGLESRALSEQLASRIECRVDGLDGVNPEPAEFVATLIETSALSGVESAALAALIARLKAATGEGGHHAVMPGGPHRGGGEPLLSSEALRPLYSDWKVELPPRQTRNSRSRNAGFLATRPASK